jgi:hypothetical protein
MHHFTILTSSEPGLNRFGGFGGDFTFLGSSVPALGSFFAMVLKFLQRYNIIKVLLQVI